jgi:hypothetical protein
MNIQFDSNISQSEAQGIILLLQSLFPSLNNSQPVNSPQAHLPDPAPAEQTTHTQSGPSLVQPESETSSKRTRRTKAQIEADEAAAKQANGAGPAAEPTLQTAIESTTEPGPTITPITKEELTSLANGFIQRHSMEDAFAAINAFGCSRINEAMALPPEKLAALAEKLRG